jgi:outer membrane protein TolC
MPIKSTGMIKINTSAILVSANCVLAGALVSPEAAAQSIEKIVAKAITNNPKVSAANASASGVQSEIEVARAALRPKFGLSAGPGTGYNFGSGSNSRGGDIQAIGNYPLYDGNRSVNEISRQESRYSGSLEKVNQTRDQLIALVTETYVEVVKQEALVKIATENVAAHQSLMDKVLEIVQLDRGRAVDATQVAVRLQQSKVNLNAQTNLLNESRAALTELLNGASFTTEPLRDVTPALPKSLLEAKTALVDHPTYKAALADQRVGELAAKIAGSWNKPKVELVGTLNNPASATNRRYFSNVDVRLSVQLPILDGGAGEAAAKAAQMQSVAAQEQARAVLKDLEAEVSRGWAQLQSRSGRAVEFIDLALRAREVRAAYWEQFRIGRRSILDLLNAENEGFQAMLAAEQIRFETIQFQFRMLSATGRLTSWFDLNEASGSPTNQGNNQPEAAK